VAILLGIVAPLHAAAAPLTGWHVTQGTGATTEVLNFDVVTGNSVETFRVLQGSIQFTPNTSPEAMAEMLADKVNELARDQLGTKKNIASAVLGNVVTKPGFFASIEKNTSKGFFKLLSDVRPVIHGIPIDLDRTMLSIRPDPDTGEASLTEEGSFGIEDSLGLGPASFFTAPEGTTNAQLAELFAANINLLLGYSASAVDHMVIISVPVGTMTFFLVDGNPFEYQLLPVPEPSTAALGSVGAAVLLIFAVLRRGAGWKRGRYREDTELS
jgi:hypothetical protein